MLVSHKDDDPVLAYWEYGRQGCRMDQRCKRNMDRKLAEMG